MEPIDLVHQSTVRIETKLDEALKEMKTTKEDVAQLKYDRNIAKAMLGALWGALVLVCGGAVDWVRAHLK